MKHKCFAAVVLAAALLLTGCGGAAAPAAPAGSGAASQSAAAAAVQTAQKERITDQWSLEKTVPTGKEAKVLEAINRVWKKKYEEKAVVHEQLTLNQDAVDAIRCYGRVFEEVNETPHKLTSSDFGIVLGESGGLAEKLKKYGGEDSLAGAAGISEPSTEKVVALEDEYSCEDTAVRVFVDKLLNNSNSAKAEFISIYLPVVKNVTYMTAVVFRNNNP